MIEATECAAPAFAGADGFSALRELTRPTDPRIRWSEMSNLTRISRGRGLTISRGRSLTIPRGRRLPAIASQHAVVVPDIPVALIDVSEGCSLLSPVDPTADRRQGTAFHSYIRTASEIGSLRRLRTG